MPSRRKSAARRSASGARSRSPAIALGPVVGGSARRVRLLALGLPDQRADRHDRLVRDLGGRARIARRVGHGRDRHPRHAPDHRRDRLADLRSDRGRQPRLGRSADRDHARAGALSRRRPSSTSRARSPEADGAAALLPLRQLHRRQYRLVHDLVHDRRRRLLHDALPAECPRLLGGEDRPGAAADGASR